VPKDEGVFYYIGEIYYGMKDYKNAVDSYDRAIDINPRSLKALYRKKDALKKLEDYRAIIAVADRILKLDSEDRETWFDRGFALEKLKRYKDAVRSYEKAVDIDPKFLKAFQRIKECLKHLKDYKLLGTRYEPYMPDGVLPYHGLTVLYLNGRWLWEDATLDSDLCHRRRYRLVEFDPDDHALLPATDLDGNPHFESLGSFGPYPDLPRVLSDAFSGLEEWEKWQALVKRTHITM